ncbi:MAG: hypothetical protein KJ795_00125 [Gammaproteobacteria bacterium]|nr:hypothetical protein [Gammaproteobacteria bacterium]MBU1777380.1 hypothetical protein [Gammaproteobacteria bacterium]
MPTWNIDEARTLVAALHGKKQSLLAHQSMTSTIDRLDYARYHYRNILNLFHKHIEKHQSPMDFFKASIKNMGDDEENELYKCIGAHVIACVQSLHSIADIYSHAIYYALGYNLAPSPLLEDKIYLNAVKNKLTNTQEHQHLAQSLSSFSSNADFTYLDALSNHSKHSSLIRPAIFVDLTGKQLDPYTLEFDDFVYKTTQYPRRAILSFLQQEIDRQSLCIIELGNELNVALRSAR